MLQLEMSKILSLQNWCLYLIYLLFTALGQVMLYVDGMNGVMDHNETVQWLYALIASKFRLVVKTALKLLLVFVEYVETNCLLLIKAVHAVDSTHGKQHAQLPRKRNVAGSVESRLVTLTKVYLECHVFMWRM